MPKATISQELHHRDLQSCPGGYVKLRPLPYGDALARRDGAARLSVEGNERATIETMQLWAREFEFRVCIVEHNLEDEHGAKLDFSNPLTFQVLDPRIGYELETLIDELNGESEEDAKDFPIAATSSSSEISGQIKLDGITDEPS